MARGALPTGTTCPTEADRAVSTTDVARRPEHARNPALERVLGDLNGLLARIPPADTSPRPLVLVVGAPRTGTTLLLQELAASGRVAYLGNLAARAWSRPSVGLLLQRVLADPSLQFRDELADVHEALARPGRTSVLGKTSGALGPNEAWYVWRHHLGEGIGDVRHPLPDRDAWQRLAAALHEAAAADGRPLAAKAMIAWRDLPAAADAMPAARFVRVRRAREDIVDSVLQARVEHTGATTSWWSFRTHAEPMGTPRRQVAAQVAAIEDRVDDLVARHPERSVQVRLEDLVAEPRRTIDTVLEGLA